jgi:guanylate kinase
MATHGNLFIVTAPSGTGKTTLVAALLAADAAVQLSVSHTTRSPRAGEVNGQHYHFIDRAQFEQMIAQQDFLEHAEVYGNYYGTSLRWIQAQQAQGRDILLEIDWQGAAQVRQLLPDAIGIFILPPSIEALETRLRGRGTDSEETILKRMAVVRSEVDHAEAADYLIFNEHIDEAVRDLLAVVRAERLKTASQVRRRAPQLRAMQSHG